MAAENEMIRRQRALADFGDFVLDHEDLDAVLNEGCRLIARALNADLAKVIEIERDANTGLVRAGVGWKTGIVGHERVSLSERSSEAFAIEKTRPVITNDLAHETRFAFPSFLRDHGVVALVNVPILLPGRRPWGVLQVDSRTTRDFDRDDIEFLKTYAMVLGPVIDRFEVAAEREAARIGLVEREARLNHVLEGMGEGFGLLAPDFTILEHNREALRLDGRTREEVVGRSHWEVYPGSEQSELGRLLKTAMAERKSVFLEHRYVWENGAALWLDMRAYPTADGALAVFWRDITQARQAVDALRESEERYRALFESMDEAYAVVEVLKDEAGRWVDFRFIEVNPAFIAHTAMPWPVGRTATELLGTPNPRWTRLYGQALDTGQPIRVEEDEPTLGRTFDLNIFTLDRARNRVAVLFTNITARKRAEAVLRESEERFQQFAQASAAGLWIRDARTLDMEFVSPAVGTIYGVPPETLLGAVERWAGMIVPEDRGLALGHLDKARAGDTTLHEFRIQRPSDGAFRWIRNTDFPLHGDGEIQRIGGIAEDVTEGKLAVEHQGVLLAELQHRVRNIMAIIRSITARTGGRAESVPDYVERISGRLMALARVQALITRKADGGVRLTTLLRDELSAQAEHEEQYDLAGPDVLLSPKAAEVMTLAIHELATNALKYGALAREAGKVTARWDVVERSGRAWLVFDWTETGGPERQSPPDRPRRRGFGTELIEGRIPYELGGGGRVVIAPGGARCHLEFPLQDGASALETSAPQRAKVYGGVLDMAGEARLDGAVILVVEDEYYIATDTARALQGAGADVVGPFPTETAARSAIDEQRPDAVVVDINLGTGPSFKLAETLRDRGIPFVFVTGYDQQVIPEEFSDVERLEKPVQLRRVVGAVSALLTPAG